MASVCISVSVCVWIVLASTSVCMERRDSEGVLLQIDLGLRLGGVKLEPIGMNATTRRQRASFITSGCIQQVIRTKKMLATAKNRLSGIVSIRHLVPRMKPSPPIPLPPQSPQ